MANKQNNNKTEPPIEDGKKSEKNKWRDLCSRFDLWLQENNNKNESNLELSSKDKDSKENKLNKEKVIFGSPWSIGITFAFIIGGSIVWLFLNERNLNYLFVENFLNANFFLYVSINLAIFTAILLFYVFLYLFSIMAWRVKKLSICCYVISLLVLIFIYWLLLSRASFGFLYVFFWATLLCFIVICYWKYEIQKIGDKLGLPPIRSHLSDFRAPVFIFCLLVLVLSWFPHIRVGVLQATTFTQTPSQSSWYALDKKFLEKFDLANFENNNSEEKSKNSEQKLMDLVTNKFRTHYNSDNNDLENSIHYKRPNTLYGYFLWNVSSTRVFCPASLSMHASPIDIKSRCLTLDEKYIQPLPDVYVTKAFYLRGNAALGLIIKILPSMYMNRNYLISCLRYLYYPESIKSDSKH